MNKLKSDKFIFGQVLFLILLMITNYSVGLDQDNIVENKSLHTYIDITKNMIFSTGLYFQQMFEQAIHYLYSLFQVAPEQDVKIQIMGKRKAVIIDDEVLPDEGDEEQDDTCPSGNEICQKNLNFFNATFFSGLLNMNDQDPADIDRRDNEYRKMRMQQLKLLYGATAVKTDDEFNYNE